MPHQTAKFPPGPVACAICHAGPDITLWVTEMEDKLVRLCEDCMLVKRQRENDIDRLSVYAVSYALRQQTYAAADVCDVLKRNRATLTTESISAILRDIKWAIEDNEVVDDCDVKRWQELARILVKQKTNAPHSE